MYSRHSLRCFLSLISHRHCPIFSFSINLVCNKINPYSLTISETNVFPASPQMVDMQMDKALVLEDDVRFQANFKRRVLRLMEEVAQVELDWDIM